MAEKATTKLYLKCALEASPAVISYISSTLWLIFHGPAPDTVKGSFFWLLPIVLPTLFAICYLFAGCIFHCGNEPKSNSGLFKKEPYQQRILNAIRSFTCGGVIANMLLRWEWMILVAIVSGLKPLGGESSDDCDPIW